MLYKLKPEEITLLQSSMIPSEQGDPVVGDYIVYIDDNIIRHKNQEDLYQDGGLFTTNTLYSLLKVTKITRNSLYTATPDGYGYHRYFRFIKLHGTFDLVQPTPPPSENWVLGYYLTRTSANLIFPTLPDGSVDFLHQDQSTCNHCQKKIDAFYRGKYFNSGICEECHQAGVTDTCNCQNCAEMD